jgi:hypothetical protein
MGRTLAGAARTGGIGDGANAVLFDERLRDGAESCGRQHCERQRRVASYLPRIYGC